jgi:hypothetical protein
MQELVAVVYGSGEAHVITPSDAVLVEAGFA